MSGEELVELCVRNYDPAEIEINKYTFLLSGVTTVMFFNELKSRVTDFIPYKNKFFLTRTAVACLEIEAQQLFNELSADYIRPTVKVVVRSLNELDFSDLLRNLPSLLSEALQTAFHETKDFTTKLVSELNQPNSIKNSELFLFSRQHLANDDVINILYFTKTITVGCMVVDLLVGNDFTIIRYGYEAFSLEFFSNFVASALVDFYYVIEEPLVGSYYAIAESLVDSYDEISEIISRCLTYLQDYANLLSEFVSYLVDYALTDLDVDSSFGILKSLFFESGYLSIAAQLLGEIGLMALSAQFGHDFYHTSIVEKSLIVLSLPFILYESERIFSIEEDLFIAIKKEFLPSALLTYTYSNALTYLYYQPIQKKINILFAYAYLSSMEDSDQEVAHSSSFELYLQAIEQASLFACNLSLYFSAQTYHAILYFLEDAVVPSLNFSFEYIIIPSVKIAYNVSVFSVKLIVSILPLESTYHYALEYVIIPAAKLSYYAGSYALKFGVEYLVIPFLKLSFIYFKEACYELALKIYDDAYDLTVAFVEWWQEPCEFGITRIARKTLLIFYESNILSLAAKGVFSAYVSSYLFIEKSSWSVIALEKATIAGGKQAFEILLRYEMLEEEKIMKTKTQT